MLDVDPLLTGAIRGSYRATWQARGWYDGQPSYHSDLPVTSWAITVDGEQPVERTGSCVVASTDEALDPVRVGDPLAVWGSEIELATGAVLGDKTVLCPLGVFKITRSRPRAARREYRVFSGERVERVPAFDGVAVDVTFADRAAKLKKWRIRGEQSRGGSSMYAELARLVNPVGTTGEHEVPDVRLATSAVYETQDRLTAIDQLARHGGARVEVSVEGLFTLVPRREARGHWEIPSGDDALVLSVDREMSDEDFVNGVVSMGRNSSTQEEYVGWHTEQSGPLRWGGPAGCADYQHDSPLITSYQAAVADAQATFRSTELRRQQVVTVECPLNPALQTWDTVGLKLPGKDHFSGQVRRWSGDSSGRMSIDVLVPLDVWMDLR